MAEIFVTGHGKNDAASRIVASELRLESPSDIYFGNASAGIAFYEKSGADLSVTLLDGSEVVIRDFFVVGPSGDYSRLLLAAGGEEEISGLVAPEPIQPRDLPDAVKNADQASLDIAAAQPDADSSQPGTPVVENTDSATADPAMTESNGESHAGGNFLGFGADKIAFAVSGVGLVAASQTSWDGDDPAPAPAPAQTAEDTSDETDLDPDLAVLIGDMEEPQTADGSDTGTDDVSQILAALDDTPAGSDAADEVAIDGTETDVSATDGLGALLVVDDVIMALDYAADATLDALLGPVDAS